MKKKNTTIEGIINGNGTLNVHWWNNMTMNYRIQ